ncbi:MAG: DUF4423 domain-containing protein [Myxococcales bacterium]|nr:DUF4423 domain-containing protein [Myxococcales bacterium]
MPSAEGTPLTLVARGAGYDRYAVSRWYRGTTQPRLPEFLTLLEATSRRLIDFIATLTDPGTIPCIEQEHRELIEARELAYSSPWAHAVLRALELQAHASLSFDSESAEVEWLMATLGISAIEVEGALAALERTGQVKKIKGRRSLHRVVNVNTSADAERARKLKGLWTGVARQRLLDGNPGLFGYSLFAVSRADLLRLRELQLQYFRQMQSVIAGSTDAECVGLCAVQLLDLAEPGRNALGALK